MGEALQGEKQAAFLSISPPFCDRFCDWTVGMKAPFDVHGVRFQEKRNQACTFSGDRPAGDGDTDVVCLAGEAVDGERPFKKNQSCACPLHVQTQADELVCKDRLSKGRGNIRRRNCLVPL